VILRANGLSDPLLGKSREIAIPAHLLLPVPDRVESRSAPPRPSKRAARRLRFPRASDPPPPGLRSLLPDVDPRRETPASFLPREHRAPSRDRTQEPPRRPPRPRTKSRPPSRSSRAADLEFGEDQTGPYALYRLKRGEALYSAVVVRYTGRVDPDDVAEAAAIIIRRSGIRSVTDIPVGYAVRIPRSMILPEFLPPGDSRRREIEAERREASEAAKDQTVVRSRDLEGIHVILDAGHGGVDPGATIAGLSEHEYAYDVLCRVKRILETTTSAKVHPLIQDPDLGFVPRPARTLRASGDERILTTPAHVNGDPSETSLGVHLRWLLANSIERRLVRSGVDPARTVFASFHADVLHPTLRGAMIYVPGERYRRGTYSCREAECARYAEAREVPSVRFDRAERLASEGLSRRFAARVIASFRKSGIGVHPDLPIRDRIVRRGRDWLPAVLRGTRCP
jgi:N-acetylmuramoyl-L-alanine amidase